MKRRCPLNDSLFSRDNGSTTTVPISTTSNVLPVFNPAQSPTYGPTAPTQGTIITDDMVIKAYSSLTGYDPILGVRDSGVSMIDALNYLRKNGLDGKKIEAYTAVDHLNFDHVKLGLYMFGGLYAGMALPTCAKTQDTWDVPAGGAKGDGAPNSWGGHCINIISYDKNYLSCITWGAVKKMTWNFFKSYCEECYVLLNAEFVGKKSPSGFDMATLQKDLKAIGKGAPQVLK